MTPVTMGERFRLFGPGHCVALGAIAVLSVVCSWAASRGARLERFVRMTTAFALPAALLALMAVDASNGVPWTSYAPLQLCDLAVPVAVAALVTRDQLAFELTFAWSAAGTFPALLTPELVEGPRHWGFVLYFAQHGGLVVASAVLLGMGLRPRPKTPWRALAWLNVTALGVGFVDVVYGANFMYLRTKPSAWSPLDWFGSWPWYLLACEFVALGVFSAACAAFRAPRSDEQGDEKRLIAPNRR